MRKLVIAAFGVTLFLSMVGGAYGQIITKQPVGIVLEFTDEEARACDYAMSVEWDFRCWWGNSVSWEDAARMQEAADREWLAGMIANTGVEPGEDTWIWHPCWPPEAKPWYPADFPEPSDWNGYAEGCSFEAQTPTQESSPSNTKDVSSEPSAVIIEPTEDTEAQPATDDQSTDPAATETPEEAGGDE
jgi:hypothetical protein